MKKTERFGEPWDSAILACLEHWLTENDRLREKYRRLVRDLKRKARAERRASEKEAA